MFIFLMVFGCKQDPATEAEADTDTDTDSDTDTDTDADTDSDTDADTDSDTDADTGDQDSGNPDGSGFPGGSGLDTGWTDSGFDTSVFVFSTADTGVDCAYTMQGAPAPVAGVFDCNGNCAPLVWLGDGVCDDGTFDGVLFDCPEFNEDDGDCLSDTSDTSDTGVSFDSGQTP